MLAFGMFICSISSPLLRGSGGCSSTVWFGCMAGVVDFGACAAWNSLKPLCPKRVIYRGRAIWDGLLIITKYKGPPQTYSSYQGP